MNTAAYARPFSLVNSQEFRGVQHTRRSNGAPVEAYDVVGRRETSGGGPRCSDVNQGVLSARECPCLVHDAIGFGVGVLALVGRDRLR